jgi:hypothetical protein
MIGVARRARARAGGRSIGWCIMYRRWSLPLCQARKYAKRGCGGRGVVGAGWVQAQKDSPRGWFEIVKRDPGDVRDRCCGGKQRSLISAGGSAAHRAQRASKRLPFALHRQLEQLFSWPRRALKQIRSTHQPSRELLLLPRLAGRAARRARKMAGRPADPVDPRGFVGRRVR